MEDIAPHSDHVEEYIPQRQSAAQSRRGNPTCGGRNDAAVPQDQNTLATREAQKMQALPGAAPAINGR